MTADSPIIERGFYMARHGQTHHNAQGLVSDIHTELTDEGKRRNFILKEVYTLLFPDKTKVQMVSSELPRARHTAEDMTGDPCHMIAMNPGLNEIENGELGGIIPVDWIAHEKQRVGPEAFDATIPPWCGGQTVAEHARQVLQGINHSLSKCPEAQTPIFVAHHGTMQRVAEAIGVANVEFKNSTLYHFVPNPNTHQWSVAEMSIDNGRLTETKITVGHTGRYLGAADTAENSFVTR